MTSFLVFRDLPGVTRDQYVAAQHAAADASRRSSAVGREVRYQGGFFLPGAGRAICIFDAESAADVAAVNEQAGVPAADVVEAIDLRTRPNPGLLPKAERKEQWLTHHKATFGPRALPSAVPAGWNGGSSAGDRCLARWRRS